MHDFGNLTALLAASGFRTSNVRNCVAFCFEINTKIPLELLTAFVNECFRIVLIL